MIKILDFFAERSAKKKLKENPIMMAALLASERALKDTGLFKIKDKLKAPIDEIAGEITAIFNSDDQIMASRKKYVESVLAFARYQVLVLDKDDPTPDETGLLGLPGITGELRQHLVKIGERDNLFKEDLHGRTDVPDELTLDYMKEYIRGQYLIWYWRSTVFDTIRIGLKDNNPNPEKDWQNHLLYSMCASHEYKFRNLLKLKQKMTIAQELMNSTFLDIALSGEKYPDLTFYEKYKDEIDSKKLYFKKIWKK